MNIYIYIYIYINISLSYRLAQIVKDAKFQTCLELSFLIHYMEIYMTIHIYYINKSHDSLTKSYIYFLNKQ